ncbi:MAG: hypothetical protein K940chlam7_00642 [Chlamydiae bacterium]|nr:hypothetical protein [Chlamydiota bacterium]
MTKILILLFFFGLLAWIVGSIVIWSIRNGISPMPTSRKAKKSLLFLLPRDLKGKVYELGSGWGTLAFLLAKALTKCQIIGYELSTFPYFISKLRQWPQRLPNLTLVRGDFFSIPLDDASLIVCYLYPGAMRRLKSKFEKELKPGTWVISNTFAIPGWEPMRIEETGDIYRSKIYLYRV